MTLLKEICSDWEDWDVVEFNLGCHLGLFENTSECWLKNKWVFWTGNSLGDTLYGMLQSLVKEGCLLENDDNQFKWNPDYEIGSD